MEPQLLIFFQIQGPEELGHSEDPMEMRRKRTRIQRINPKQAMFNIFIPHPEDKTRTLCKVYAEGVSWKGKVSRIYSFVYSPSTY